MWKDTVGRDLKAWKIGEEWASDNGKVSAEPATLHREKAKKYEKYEVSFVDCVKLPLPT